MDVEVFSSSALYEANIKATKTYDKEHVTPFIRNSPQYSKKNYEHKENLSKIRWTVDEIDDFDIIEKIFLHFLPRIDFFLEKY